MIKKDTQDNQDIGAVVKPNPSTLSNVSWSYTLPEFIADQIQAQPTEEQVESRTRELTDLLREAEARGRKQSEDTAYRDAYRHFRDELARLSGRRAIRVLGLAGGIQYVLMIEDEQQSPDLIQVTVRLPEASTSNNGLGGHK